MSDLIKYPLEDGFSTTLAQDWDGAVGDVKLTNVPSFTFPTGVTTYMVFNPKKSNTQIVEINAINSVTKKVTVSSIAFEKGAGITSSQQSHGNGSEVIISDNYQFWKDIADAINSKIDKDTGQAEVYADATARDAAITSPSNGMQVYLTSTGKFSDYISGTWQDRASAGADRLVAVSGDDTTPGDLEAKILAGDGMTLTTNNPAGNENLTASIDLLANGGLDFVGGELRIVPLSGVVQQYAGATAPTGYVLCDGQAISRTTFADLFAVISTTYGVGDGSTTFNVPDMKGKVAVHLDAGQTEFDALGETGGEKTHTLTESEMPAHTHTTQLYSGGVSGASNTEGSISSSVQGTATSASTGGGSAHNNLSPYMVLNYIIKT